MKRALVLRGEEKSDPKELDIARNELAQKFGAWSPMFYGQLPFVLGCAAAGFKIKYTIVTDVVHPNFQQPI